jgi:protein pelota
MKIVQEIPERDIIKVMPENLDDLWYLSTIIERGDNVYAVTERRVQDKGDKLRADRGVKRRMFLGVRCEKVEFHEDTNRLRIFGTIIHGPDDVPLGSHHTIEVEPFTEVSIQKRWKKWHLERLKEAVESAQKPKIVAVVMDDSEADIYLIREFGVKEVASIKSEVSKKLDYRANEQVRAEYYHEIAKTLLNYNTDKILVAGPGFGKNNFQKFASEKYKDLAKKIVVENTCTTGRTGLNEILKSGIINKIYGEARLSKEAQYVNKLLEEIAKNGLAAYGIDEVKKALNYSAIEILLVTDEMLRKRHIEEIMNLTESIGGKVMVISTSHDAGKQLKALGGIAALLRFPIE